VTARRFLRILRLRWRSLTQPSDLDHDFDRELDFHFAQLVQEQVEAGRTPVDARRAARRAMGNVAAAKDYARDHRRLAWVHDLAGDAAYAARGLRQRAAFTTTAVFALALAFGIAAAVLALIDVNLVRPLSIPGSERLVIMRTESQVDGRERDQSSLIEFLAWQSQAPSLEAVEASVGGDRDIAADADGRPAVRVATRAVTPGWFALLEVRPLLGRVLAPADYLHPGGPDVVVISYQLWRRRFGGDPRVLDRVIRVNGSDARVIGVMPPAFPYQSGWVQAWLPLRLDPDASDGTVRWFNVIARRRADVSIADVQSDVERVSATLIGRLPPQLDWHPRVVGLQQAELGWAWQPLRAAAIVAILVLLAACANVSALLIARNATRTHEFAIRVAVGATPGRLVQQVSGEALLLAALAAVPAVVVGSPAVRAIAAIVTPPIGSSALQTDGTAPVILAAVAALVLAAGIAIGLASAFSTVGRAVMLAPRVPPRSRDATAGFRGRGLLGLAQVATSVVLLVSATLVGTTYVRLARRDLHFDPSRLLLFQMRAAGTTSPDSLHAIADGVRGLDHVEATAGVSDWWSTTLIQSRATIYLDDAASPVDVRPVSLLVTPGFFSALRWPLLAGREFAGTDTRATPWTVIVNQEAARLLWPGGTPVGKRLTLGGDAGQRMRDVIGVVADTPLHRTDGAITPMIYTSYFQQPPYRSPAIGVGPAARMMLIVRYRTDRDAVARAALSRAAAVAPEVPLVPSGEAGDVGPLILQTGARGLALAAIGLVTLALAAISIYGMTSTAISERTRELAIRRALGAGRWRTILSAARAPGLVVLTGALLGGVGAPFVSKQIASDPWGVRAADMWTIPLVLVFAAGMALAAMGMPLRRMLTRNLAENLRVE
jgi:predicted permease